MIYEPGLVKLLSPEALRIAATAAEVKRQYELTVLALLEALFTESLDVTIVAIPHS